MKIFILSYLLSAWCYETLIAQSIFTGPINDVYEWNVLNYYMDYQETTNKWGETWIFGGFEVFYENTIITRFITLPPHSTIRITFDFWKYQLIIKRIDQWGADDSLIIYIDGKLILKKELYNNSGNDQCGGTDYEQISIDETTMHNFNSALIVIMVQSFSNNVFWGIQNIKLYIHECPIGCQICDINDKKPEQCQEWSLEFQSLTELTVPDFEISDWIVSNDRQRSSTCLDIPLLCKQGGLLNYCHSNTKVTLTKTIPSHTKMRLHFRLFKFDNWQTDKTILKIDDITRWEGKYFFNKGYANICGQQDYDLIDNIEIFIIHQKEEIKIEFQGQLQSENVISQSYGLRDFQIFVNSKCDDAYHYDCCGDNIKQIGEECDDGNNQPFDGCHNCQYSCVDGCSTCIQGQCYECKDGWLLQEDNKCHYQNNLIYSNCDEKCSFCYYGRCYQCNYGYTLQNNQCLTICGDGLINKDKQQGKQIEECDTLDSEGCLDCQIVFGYQCVQEDRSICWTQIDIISQCNDGYYLSNNECKQCDSICITCEVQANNCTSFYNSNCQICEETAGLYTDEIKRQCYAKCGDGILVTQYEKCDDGNLINSDGCSSTCQIETNWICSEECTYKEQPKFQVQLVNQDYNQYYVQLSFTEQVKRQSDSGKYEDYIKITLDVDQSLPFNITLLALQPATFTLNQVIYEAEIIINTNLEQQPYLDITLEELLYNNESLALQNNYQRILLNKPSYVSEEQLKTTSNIVTSYKVGIYSLSTAGGLLLLSGTSACFWNALDVLQEQSYLKFINVNYPENMMVFFDAFNIISITPFLEYLRLDSFFIPSLLQLRVIETDYKFGFYEINGSLGYNIKSFSVSFICLLISYVLTGQGSRLLSYMTDKFCTYHFFIAKFLKSINFRFIKMNHQILKYGMRQLFIANFWDLSFTIFLQLKYGTNEDLNFNLVAYALLLISIVFILQNFNGQKSKKKSKEKYLETFTFFKKLLIMLMIVFLQENYILQVNLLGIVNAFYLCCIIKIQSPNRTDFIKKALSEISLFIVIMTTQFFEKVSCIEISQEWKINLAWLHVGILCFVTVSHLLFDSYKVTKQFLQKLIKLTCNKPIQIRMDENLGFQGQDQKIVRKVI